jgi:[ribosomal protein S5]-alanine N-acetyltransferase
MLAVNFKPFPTLNTERLTFRQLFAEDDEEIFKLRSDERVNKFLTRNQYKTLQEAGAFINKINRGISNNEWIYWAIAFKNQPKLIGTICLWNIQPENYRAEIGYELHPDLWGKGVMKEAIPKIIGYGFSVMGLHSLEADIHPDNLQSVKHLEKNGFVKEGHFKESTYFCGRFVDRIVYSLLNSKKN